MRTFRFLTVASLVVGGAAWAGAGKEYAKQQTIGEGQLAGIKYVACDSKDRLVALLGNGTVKIFDKEGKPVQEFASGLDKAVVVAVGPKDCIYVVAAKTESKEVTVRGRKVNREEPVGSVLRVFDSAGKKVKETDLKDAKQVASGAFSKGALLLADRASGSVLEFNPDTGAKLGTFGSGTRTCCGIFGFGVAPSGDVLIANLGGFKVDRYAPDGKSSPKASFGKRGEDNDSFHGCCNPVNVVVLPDGRLLTAEKSKTRIKIYDAEGTKCEQVLDDVTQLVQGCAYIPMAADSKGNVYLANCQGGCVVKCGPKT